MMDLADSALSTGGKCRRPAVGRAFTLIELLVVIAIIGVVAAGFGFALSDSGGNALATGQTTLATMVNTARAQAAVLQTETRLMIFATRGDPEKFLRLIQVFRAEPQGSNTWLPVGSAVSLPRGIFVVPTSTAGFLAAGVVWPTNPPLLSTLAGPVSPNQVVGTPFGNNTAYYIQFNPDGTVQQVGSQAYARLLVATGALANNIPQFNNAGAVRGLLIRPSGGVTFVNDATSF
jgi:prepilin-type N-terminal cleavage/methylation domain-containing protein